MATEDSTPTPDPRVAAAGHLLNEVADALSSIVELAHSAVCEQGDYQASLLTALALIAGRAGWLADRSAKACGSMRLKDDDDWLVFSRSSHNALAILEAQKEAA